MSAEHNVSPTAVITGAASGIGLATARLLAARGYRLVLADVEAERLRDAAARLGSRVESLEVVVDVSNKREMDQLADITFEQFGRPDVLFLNAGVAVGGPVVDMTHADWSWVLGVNLWGPIHGIEAFLPRMVDAGSGGHVLFTASFAGLVPNVGLGTYVVSKYGVVGLAEVLHRELRSKGIGVSVLCPMLVATDVDSSERNRPAVYGGPHSSPKVPAQSDPTSPLSGRILPVETVALAVIEVIGTSRLYVLPHEESRSLIRRRFDRIDEAFDDSESA
jgi:NAD(P)-dependent dehydrogenase (short-subunit alcohol dehydrogenase family)